jgi:hypothetical protein
MQIRGVQIVGANEVVINRSRYIKQNDDSWVHYGKKTEVVIPHEVMVNRIHNVADNWNFDVWLSEKTINFKNPYLIS